jgi:hypothetical protein
MLASMPLLARVYAYFLRELVEMRKLLKMQILSLASWTTPAKRPE